MVTGGDKHWKDIEQKAAQRKMKVIFYVNVSDR
jgi:hypothetical protein